MTTIRLIAKDGRLFYPDTVKDQYGDPGPILLCIYDEGDCDAIEWPNPNRANLKRTLFDNREEGFFGDDDFIELPDHTPVLFDDAD